MRKKLLILPPMGKQSKTKVIETVKLDKVVVDQVREHKEKTGVSISKFFELAAEKELKKSKQQ